MHSFQSEDDYEFSSMAAQSEPVQQVKNTFPYDQSHDTYLLGYDKPSVAKLVPHPPLKGRKSLLRRTQSNPEGASKHGEGSQMSHLPALKEKKTLRMGKLAEDQASNAGMTTRPNDLSTLAKMHRIPEKVAESAENVYRNQMGKDVMNRHKKLERSKTTPVTFLKPVLKANPGDVRRRIQMSTLSPRGNSVDDQRGLCRSQNITTTRNNASFNGGSIYGSLDIESHGLFKELEKTYGYSEPSTPLLPMTRALPNGKRFGSGRMEEKYKEEQTSSVISTTPPSLKPETLKPRSTGLKEKKATQEYGKFTRTGRLLTGLQFTDSDVEPSYELPEKKTEDSQDLTYLRFTKERQEDNRI